MKVNRKSSWSILFLLFFSLLFAGETNGQQMPARIHDSLAKLVGTWEITTRVDDQTVLTVVTLKWSADENTIHYEAKGGNLTTGKANTTFSGILGWDGVQRVVREYSYTSLGETMQASHIIENGSWRSPTKSVTFEDGKPLHEEKMRHFQWDSAGRLTIKVTERKRGNQTLPDQYYHFRRVGPDSDAVAIRLVQDSIVRWRTLWKTQNVDELTKEFAENGIRVLGRSLRPHVGSQAIRDSFRTAFTANESGTATKLSAEVLQAKFLDDRHILADGVFTVADAKENVVRRGKWANVFVVDKSRTRVTLLMEAAFESLPLDSVSQRELPKEGLELVKPSPLKDKELAAMIDRNIKRYAEGVLHSNSKLIATEFTADGIRSVSEFPETVRGRNAILKSLRIVNEGSSPYARTVLKAVILDARRLNDRLAIANGLWQAVDEQGRVVDYGQWGNVLQIEDGEVQLLQESAGSYQP